VLRLFTRAAVQHPDAFGHLLQALDFHLSPTREVALVSPEDAEFPAAVSDFAALLHADHRPHVVLAGGPEGTDRPELMLERTAVGGEPAAYVCEGFACKAPVTEPGDLAKQLG
jgi:uncharacterized protein YyaL (SSP411 family)